MTFCVTGNRPEKFPFNYYNTASLEMTAYFTCLKNLVSEYLSRGYTRFITGMARGVDIDFAEQVVNFKKTFRQYKDVVIEAAVPHKGQADRYDVRSKRKYDFILSNCDKVTFLADEYSSDCFFKRNRYMVDNSDSVIAFWNGDASGGTFYTINYARERGKDIRLISLKTMTEK